MYADAKEFSDQPPLAFLTPKLKSEIEQADGQVDQALWEIALSERLAEVLRAGTIYLPNSQSYRPLDWEIKATKADRKVTLRNRPLLSSFEVYRKQRTEEYYAVCETANKTILDQPEVEIREGHVHIGRPVAKPEPEDMTEFRAQLKEAIEKRKLPDIMGITLNWVDYLQPFRRLVSHDVRLPHLDEVPQAIIMSEACNIGPDTMANSTPGITNVHIARVGDRCLSYNAIEAARAMFVDAYNRAEIAGLYGRGDRSSLDGMLVPIPVKAFMARLHPKAPKGKRVVNFMRWLVDKMMGFSGLVVQTTSHEAMYEFDGLFHNITQLRPTKHTADTSGFSALLFGTASLFDIYYAPRIRDFHTLHFYCADRKDKRRFPE